MIAALKISAVSAASPDMPDTEFQALLEDIQKHGQLVPIVVNGDHVVDGRKRFKACELLGIKPKTCELLNNQSPRDAARSLNIMRTHYTHDQRAMFGAQLVTATTGDARKFRRSNVSTTVKIQRLPVTVAAAAQQVGVSASQVAKARALRSRATPEIVNAVDADKLSLVAGLRIAQKPKAEQPQALLRVLAAPRRATRGLAASRASGKRRAGASAEARILETRLAGLVRQVDEDRISYVIAHANQIDARLRMTLATQFNDHSVWAARHAAKLMEAR